MRKKNILLIVAASLLLLSIILHTPIGAQLHLQIIKPVNADSNTIIVPTNYTKIQDAIDAAEPGDTIYVYNDTYYEHLLVNKTVTLIGENKSTTIIDGGGTGIVILSNASDIEIRGFTIQNGGVSLESGILLGRRSSGNIIRDNIIRNNAYGITLIGNNGCSIINNLIMNCPLAGIQIKDSINNDIHENTIVNNLRGVEIPTVSAFNNTFYHNNFIDNQFQVTSFATTNWDNGTEGNYWSDYMGVDTDGDGIGDTETPHPDLGLDNNPLIIPTRPFPVVVDGVIYLVALLSNSTVSEFYFSHSPKEIGFYVSGPSNTTGFCRICIPTALMNDTYRVLVNGTEVLYTILPCSNNARALSFTYDQSIQDVLIISEFPATIFLPLLIILTLVTVILGKRKKRSSYSLED